MIVPMRRSHAADVAEIHTEVFSGDFLPCLGFDFLRVLYDSALAGGVGFGFVHVEDDQRSGPHERARESPSTRFRLLRGFIFGCVDTRALFKHVLLHRTLALTWAALPAVLRRPRLLRYITETVFYPNKERRSPHLAELVAIGVEAAVRGRGIGERLVAELRRAFRQRGISSCRVTVLQSNEDANRFYGRLGFRRTSEFTLYGKRWNVYVLDGIGTSKG